MMHTNLEEHYGRVVWVNTDMEPLRKQECLCYNCERMKPGEPDHCQLAADFYEVCKRGGVAFIVTRCGKFVHKK